MPIIEANDDREFYEARRVMTRFLTGGKAEVSLPDASTAVLTSGRFGPYPGVISTSTAEYTVDRSRMKSDGRAVVRYVGGGIYKNMKSIGRNSHISTPQSSYIAVFAQFVCGGR